LQACKAYYKRAVKSKDFVSHQSDLKTTVKKNKKYCKEKLYKKNRKNQKERKYLFQF
jgi:hypothetical protein